jgi:hypothetical protein
MTIRQFVSDLGGMGKGELNANLWSGMKIWPRLFSKPILKI